VFLVNDKCQQLKNVCYEFTYSRVYGSHVLALIV